MSSEKKPTQANTSHISPVDLVDKYKVHKNTDQDYIITTEDKARLCLAKYSSRLGKRRSWIAPLGILIAIILAIVTTTFKDFGLEAEVWKALFIISAIIVFGWLLYAVKESWHSVNEDVVIDELKQDSTETITPQHDTPVKPSKMTLRSLFEARMKNNK